MKPTNVIITGVGGQGNVLAARIVAGALLELDYEVTVGDVFGLSQRGGAVASHLRFHRGSPLPPLVPSGQLDALLGFEPMEALRILCQFGNRETVVLVNTQAVLPIGALRGEFEYPSVGVLFDQMRELSKTVIAIDGDKILRQLGQAQGLNMVMVGALVGSGLLPLAVKSIEEQIKSALPTKSRGINCRALALGIQAVRSIPRVVSLPQ